MGREGRFMVSLTLIFEHILLETIVIEILIHVSIMPRSY